MSLEIEMLEKIEHYTKGKMSFSDVLEFEKEVEANPLLQSRVQASQIVDQIVIGYEAMKLKAQMQKDMSSPKSKLPTYMAVGLVAVLAGSFVYTMFTKEETKTQATIQASKIDEKKIAEVKQTSLLPAEKSTVSEPQKRIEKSAKHTDTKPVNTIEEKQIEPVAPKQTIALPEMVVSKNVESQVPAPVNKAEITQVAKPQIADKKAVVASEKVEEKSAPLAVSVSKQKEYVFNPEYDQSWTIPYDSQKEPSHFRVLDKAGRLFYQTNVEASSPAEWRGESNTGSSFGQGLHFFSIEYKDGTVEEGSIMISR